MEEAKAEQESILEKLMGKESGAAEVAAAQYILSFLKNGPKGAAGKAENSVVEWVQPEGESKGLEIYNTLSHSKVPFVPANGNRVGWYICGPTVYDSSHIGHARNYVTFDIIRRILEDFFGYEVFSVMNVTDVDDKIILRARRNHLFEKYSTANPTLDDAVLSFVSTCVEEYKFAEKQAELEEKVAAAAEGNGKDVESEYKLKMLLELKKACDAAIDGAKATVSKKVPSKDLLSACKDVIAPVLDAKDGHSVVDHSIFRNLAVRFEKEFLEDMATLECRPSHVLTRVSEYTPEVISCIERIIASGAAYEANGSVYFDTQQFIKNGHQYCKLEPWSFGNDALASEGEGALSSGTGEKRSKNDFVLWKKSKAGEPAWDSPWGQGRPGWHIECSAMALDCLGDTLDIHSGGEDLRFPHHDNEIAQAEACCGSHQWVNYFLHSGHLHVEGAKMSKSLKNFVTIRDALKAHTPRQIRMLFLLHPWRNTLDYGEQSMRDVLTTERTFKEFFMNVAVRAKDEAATQKWTAHEKTLSDKLRGVQAKVRACLCNSFDTPGAMRSLMDLVKAGNVYVRECDGGGIPVKTVLLERVAAYITDIFKVFGLVSGEGAFGFPASSTAAEAGSKDGKDEVAEVFKKFRDDVRSLAGSSKRLAEACDKVEV